MNKAEMYYEYLKEEGYVPRYDSDGDIVFKVEGLTYLLFASEDDEPFFRLCLPNIWKVESAAERERALAAACRVNAEIKVVKLHPVEDNVWSSVEMLIDPPEGFKPVFDRALKIVRLGAERFVSYMNTPVQ
ncbi:T3SS (YopN, CesT) and YbjN peptide-binding chaperone 1 [Symbiobacterium thermophilum]|uniref:T3SS (YopN, CesT) and YbjN peptide-binding chaperone 1 n=1 Tax=Symbiobacterium thermophilum TaxID=2734 RepID=UPI0035C6BD42